MGSLAAEADDLARMSAAAYTRLMDYYRREYKVSPPEADAMAMERYTLDGVPSHEVRWLALNTLLDSDPAAAAAIWRRVAYDAANYVHEGFAVADALNYESPWQRAQFLAIRRALYDEWQPSAVERLLLDTIAHSYVSYLYWAGRVQSRATEYPHKGDRPPLQSVADAIDQAAQMMDRFNRLQARTLRALRDLRRAGVVNVLAAPGSQVNIGQQQAIMNKQETAE
jgi:hypothetical protein